MGLEKLVEMDFILPEDKTAGLCAVFCGYYFVLKHSCFLFKAQNAKLSVCSLTCIMQQLFGSCCCSLIDNTLSVQKLIIHTDITWFQPLIRHDNITEKTSDIFKLSNISHTVKKVFVLP